MWAFKRRRHSESKKQKEVLFTLISNIAPVYVINEVLENQKGLEIMHICEGRGLYERISIE